jgi:ABC-type enterochelin transport system permease subunit
MKEAPQQSLSDLEVMMLVCVIVGVLWMSLSDVFAAFW